MTTNDMNDVSPLRNYNGGFEGFSPNPEFVLPSSKAIQRAWALNTGIKDKTKSVHGQSSPQALVDGMKPSAGTIRGVVNLGDGRFRVFGFGIPNSSDKNSPVVISKELLSKLSALTDEQYEEQAEGLLWSCAPDRAYAFSSFYQDYALDYTPDGRGSFTAKEVQSAAGFIKELSVQISDTTAEERQARNTMWNAAQYLGSR